jgi:hypothetical protein
MNLQLSSMPATGMPDDQQKDLTFALMELLIRAAGKNEQPGNGGEDESETHA